MKEWFIKWYGLDLSEGMAGLGPNSLGWIRIIFPYQKRFYKGSCLHDFLYSEGNILEDKIYADKTFYEINLENCKTYLQSWFALLYYNLVDKYGHCYFNYQNKNK